MPGKMLDENTYPFPNFNSACLGVEKQYHLTLYDWCDYLSMLKLKFIHDSERGPWQKQVNHLQRQMLGPCHIN